MQEYRSIVQALRVAGNHFWFLVAVGALLAAASISIGMNLFSNFMLFLVSLAVLLKSADFLVCGSSKLAKYFGISAVIIGITVVAFGTSLPELVVSLLANLAGSTGISLGNVVGSNISNICLVLGLAALIVPIKVHKELFRFDAPFLIGISLLLPVLSVRAFFDFSPFPYVLGLVDGLILLMLFGFFMYIQIGVIRRSSEARPKDRVTESMQDRGRKKLLGYCSLILGGLIGVTFSAALLVHSGRELARLMGVPELFIGLTMIAVGTSLPELATNIVAALRRQLDIAVGNVIGSNVFNILLILGTASVLKPIDNISESVVAADMPIMIGLTALLILLMRRSYLLSRLEGILLVALYIAYISFLSLTALT